jgi:hypothetical protein
MSTEIATFNAQTAAARRKLQSKRVQLAVVLAGPDGQPQAIDGKQVQIVRFKVDGNWRETLSKLNQIEIGDKSYPVRNVRGVGPSWH